MGIFFRRGAFLYFNGPAFLGVCGVFLLAVGALQQQQNSVEKFVQAAIGFWAALYAIGLALESIIWFGETRSYAGPFGFVKAPMLTVKRASAGAFVDELRAVGAIALAAVASLSLAVYTLERNYGGFTSITATSGLGASAASVFQCFYFVVSNIATVGDNEIGPTSNAARAVTILIFLFDIAILGALGGSFTSTRSP